MGKNREVNTNKEAENSARKKALPPYNNPAISPISARVTAAGTSASTAGGNPVSSRRILIRSSRPAGRRISSVRDGVHSPSKTSLTCYIKNRSAGSSGRIQKGQH